ncbi:sigma-70 family RNA polymerase sigma factor [soil metagenome]
MTPDGVNEITVWLRGARAGDANALARLFEALYPDLRRIARRRLSRDARGTLLDTTALVHECYLKLADAGQLQPDDRAHFLAYAATAMRSIVFDFARARLADRRGGGVQKTSFDSANEDHSGIAPEGAHEILAIHDALDELAKLEPRLANVVEMRYFGGLMDAEIAEALGTGVRTVRRDWQKARIVLSASLRLDL